MKFDAENFPVRPAWVEIDLARLRQNLRLIRRDLPAAVRLMAILKDEAYGHGALDVARIAVEEGAWGFGLSTLEEAMALRDAGITAPLLLLGERQAAELEWCVAHNLTVCVNEPHTVRALARVAAGFDKQVPVHLKIHTGMSRYGVRWDEALPLIEQILAEKSLRLEGVMSHFAQSDEPDKTFANLQQSRFTEVLNALAERKIPVDLRHLCNSGGFLDLPPAYLDMVRVGILLHGVYPSTSCRRIPGIEPVMSVKAKIAAIQKLKPGESVGYGMRFWEGQRPHVASPSCPSVTATAFPACATKVAPSSTASALRSSAAWPWTPSPWTSPTSRRHRCGTKPSSWAARAAKKSASTTSPN